MLQVIFASTLGFMLAFVGWAFAQAVPPQSTQAERTLRQGDIIEWHAVSGTHKVRFGGTVGATTLTPISEVDDYIGSFDPALTIVTKDVEAVAPKDGASNVRLLKATVIDTAQADKTFNFTCGVHPADMLSRAFKIAPKVPGEGPRTFKITGEAGQNWILELPGGKRVSIDTTPPT